jgi:isochorismate hydrolase
MPELDKLPFAITQRLRLIELMLIHTNSVNRAVLSDYFGISTQQASTDFQLYQKLAPNNMQYDVRGKTYRRTDAFQRLWS